MATQDHARRNRRNWEPHAPSNQRASTLMDPIGRRKTRTIPTPPSPRLDLQRSQSGLNPCEGVFSPFEKAQVLMKGHASLGNPWNAPTSGHKDAHLRTGRTSSSSRPSSSTGTRSSAASTRLSSAERVPQEKAPKSQAGRPGRIPSVGPPIKGKASTVLHQKNKNREKAHKARLEEFERVGKLLEGGLRVPKPNAEGLDFVGSESSQVPGLDTFVELQCGVLERWQMARDTAMAALEAVMEAEKMMDNLAEFWTHADNLKKRRWDAGVDGFLELNKAIEKDMSDSVKGEETESKGSSLSTSGKDTQAKQDKADATKDGSLSPNAGEEFAAGSDASRGLLESVRDRTASAALNTGRSSVSVSSTVSSKSGIGSTRSGPEDTSTCIIKTADPYDQGVHDVLQATPAEGISRAPLVQWSSSHMDGSVANCRTFVRDFKALVPRFQADSEVWFLKVIENAFVTKGKRGVYSREDCCTLLNTLSKVQEWLETEPAKSRAAINHPQDIRHLIRDTVIYWGSQLFFLPSAAS